MGDNAATIFKIIGKGEQQFMYLKGAFLTEIQEGSGH